MEFIIIGLLLLIIAEVYLLTRTRKHHNVKPISMLVDTSVIMDGRVVELAETGFLLGQVIVPKSVLAELQLLADGSDHTKRERARLGMDVVKKLKDILGSSFTLLQDGAALRGVDEALITLAKETDSAILTLDYNLNKVAQVEGVKVLNINELAKSIRMVHLPGDIVTISLVQKGQSSDQAVGYLSDGTMVVVEQAKKYIGKTEEVEIIRSLQTDAGKMMFARLTRKDAPVEKQSKREPTSRRPVEKTARTNIKSPKAAQQSTPRAKTSVKSHNQQRSSRSKRVDHEAELIRLAEKQ